MTNFLGDRHHAAGETVPRLGPPREKVVEKRLEQNHSLLDRGCYHIVRRHLCHSHRLHSVGQVEPRLYADHGTVPRLPCFLHPGHGPAHCHAGKGIVEPCDL